MNTLLRYVFFFLFFVTTSAQSALISLNGYTLNSDTNIVSNGELDWLQWDINRGISREDVENTLLDNAQYQGWRYATYNEMLSLIKTFFPFVDTNSVHWYQSTRHGLTVAEYVDYSLFHELITTELDDFGQLFGSINSRATFSSLTVNYGDVSFDNDSGGVLVNSSQSLSIFDGLIDEPTWEDKVRFSAGMYESSWQTIGHALVRKSIHVSSPTTLPLLVLGLIFLFRRILIKNELNEQILSP
mmetsp:Transcript_27557/g.35561  ORF Transcript_27557/g.35561 Transcript_27557/m.35561 type:complete len:243 (+) Transcript_27557:30-758(+)